MALFPCFPKIERFCFCTRNLKCAAVVIIILGMISSINRIAVLTGPHCKTLYDDSPVSGPLNAFMYLQFVFEMILLTCSFVFFLNIFFYPNPIVADIYICVALATAFLSIVFAIIETVQGFYVNCGFQPEVINFFVHVAIWMYFVIVINTFRDSM